jgi:hypothetical protein
MEHEAPMLSIKLKFSVNKCERVKYSGSIIKSIRGSSTAEVTLSPVAMRGTRMHNCHQEVF